MIAADSTLTPGRTPSVSELQAALLAARRGHPATLNAAPAAAASPQRPEAAAPRGTGAWLLGTHGGSGARCLAAVLPGTRLAGNTWPTPTDGREPVVLVCRGNHRGLSSAQDYARTYRDSGLAGQLQLVGVIVSADAPGRTPTPLRRLERLLSGAVPILGHAPWEPTWRIAPPRAGAEDQPLPWAARLGDALAAVAALAA